MTPGGGLPADLPAPLRRFLQQRPAPVQGETCEFCSEPVPDEHRHVVDLHGRELSCSCRGCALLFLGEGAGGGRYRTVPEDYVRVEPLDLPLHLWAGLQIPVGTAFVLHSSVADRTVAFYPGPGGATESELPLATWGEIVAANPPLAQVRPDVEAALLRGGGDPDDMRCYIVPIDRCYELVGSMRRSWRGFDGGQEVRGLIDAFFADIEARSRPPRAVRAGS